MTAEPAPAAERKVVLTFEGTGVIATCRRCGWLQWHPSKPPARAAALGHKCKAKRR